MPFSHDEVQQIGFRDAEVRLLPPPTRQSGNTPTKWTPLEPVLRHVVGA
jgi:hypothetical protein